MLIVSSLQGLASGDRTEFSPRFANESPPAGKVPDVMVWVPDGEFQWALQDLPSGFLARRLYARLRDHRRSRRRAIDQSCASERRPIASQQRNGKLVISDDPRCRVPCIAGRS